MQINNEMHCSDKAKQDKKSKQRLEGNLDFLWSFYIRENCASPYEYPLTVSMTVNQNLRHV
jgi:hypothetical protein